MPVPTNWWASCPKILTFGIQTNVLQDNHSRWPLKCWLFGLSVIGDCFVVFIANASTLCEVCYAESGSGTVSPVSSVPLATSFCRDCNQKLCERCSVPHKRWRGQAHEVWVLVPFVSPRFRILPCHSFLSKKVNSGRWSHILTNHPTETMPQVTIPIEVVICVVNRRGMNVRADLNMWVNLLYVGSSV